MSMPQLCVYLAFGNDFFRRLFNIQSIPSEIQSQRIGFFIVFF